MSREKIYLAAYLGSIYDQSEGTYCLDDTIKAVETDLLCSIGGAKPVSAKDTGEGNHINMRMSRILSENRGSGWHLQSVQSLAATQLLFLIEYGKKQWDSLFYKKENGKYQLNLWRANELVFLESGILPEHISVTDVCTCCNPEILYSHRASKGMRGNLAAFLGLRKNG